MAIRFPITEDQIDSFALELHNLIQYNPLWIEDEDEGYLHYHDQVHNLFNKYWMDFIKERNFN